MRLWIFCIGIMAMPVSVLAHGTDYRLIGKDAVVVMDFFYSDKTPMQYAEVLVFSPENDKVEFQNGRTDQKGRFAFLAETPGDWQVKVNDGMGHAVHATVNVSAEKSKTTAETLDDNLKPITPQKDALLYNVPVSIKLFLGLSILLNLFLSMYVWNLKK